MNEVSVENLEQEALKTLPQPVHGMLSSDLAVADVSDPTLAYVVAVSRVLAARAELHLLAGTEQKGVWPRLQDFSTVDRFRQKYLPGGHLLTPDEIEGWILDWAATDTRTMRPSRWVVLEAWYDPEDVERHEEDGIIFKAGAKLHFEPMIGWTRRPDPDHPYAGATEERAVEYAFPKVPHRRQPVRGGGVLDALRLRARTLASIYRWTEAQATVYLLTGLAPIAATYAKMLIEEQDRRPRAMSRKHLQLAEFTAEHLIRNGESLAVRLDAWNTQYPEWAYRTVSHFGGDSLLALRRTEGDQDDGKEHRSSPESQ